jgi:5,10-methylenetetrahydrofolate reductase
MPRSLAEALRAYPLFFAPVPPPSRTPSQRAAQRIEEVVGLIERIPRIDAVDVPELVDENHEGRPRYRTDDPRSYARMIADRSGREVVVNKVVAHLESFEALAAWARETVRIGVRNTVLVGGTSRFIPYPGPPVAEANRIVHPILAGSNGFLGNIAIPQRRGEAHRMVSKTRSGATFFTTQLLFAPEAVGEMLASYDRLCGEASVTPATILLSFAPVADERDIEFVRWLGADLPEEAERRLLNGDERVASKHCVDLATEVWDAVYQRVGADRLRISLGVNIEQVSAQHLDGAGEMLAAFVRRLPAPPGVTN